MFSGWNRFVTPCAILKHQPAGKRNPSRTLKRLLNCRVETGKGPWGQRPWAHDGDHVMVILLARNISRSWGHVSSRCVVTCCLCLGVSPSTWLPRISSHFSAMIFHHIAATVTRISLFTFIPLYYLLFPCCPSDVVILDVG
jgi:hypothetical protein